MALMTGQAAGLDVPKETLRKAELFLDQSCNANDGYGYLGSGTVSNRTTSVGLLCRQHVLNWGPGHPRVVKSVNSFVMPNLPDRDDAYYRYYATQVMFHVGGKDWRAWNEKAREHLILTQDQDAKNVRFGSWNPDSDLYGRSAGRLFVTSMNLLTLQVYYRHAPFPKRPNEKAN